MVFLFLFLFSLLLLLLLLLFLGEPCIKCLPSAAWIIPDASLKPSRSFQGSFSLRARGDRWFPLPTRSVMLCRAADWSWLSWGLYVFNVMCLHYPHYSVTHMYKALYIYREHYIAHNIYIYTYGYIFVEYIYIYIYSTNIAICIYIYINVCVCACGSGICLPQFG